VAQYHQDIIKHPYLILDLRGNGGGESWVHLLPYLMTNPIRQEKSQLRVSPENVIQKRNDLSGYVIQELPKEYLKYFLIRLCRLIDKPMRNCPRLLKNSTQFLVYSFL
jgi:hypothetical protein